MSNTTIERVMAISQTFRDLAGVLLNYAYQAYKNKEISEREFWLIRMDYYEPILREGVKILMVYDHALAGEVSKHLAVIETETKRLRNAIEAIGKIDKMTNTLDKVLAAATRASVFFMSPSAAAAASVVSAIGGATSEAMKNSRESELAE